MSMTRKDYILLADSLSKSFEDIKDFNLRADRDAIDEIINHVVNNVGLALQADNPRFELERFVKACEIQS